jgi:ferrochelatase
MKTAVILFNLGGPDSPSAIRPFLFNLFNDPAIIRVPALLRVFLAYIISRLRSKKAEGIYDQMGGRSPILPNTKKQAAALQQALGDNFKVFIAMRYWLPRAAEVAEDVRVYNPTRIVLLPLYPQFSTTTTASSVTEWHKAAKRAGIGAVPTQTLCCYPTEHGFIATQAQAIAAELRKAWEYGRPRILFSAHGLPEKVVADGDPYQWQCEQTTKAIVAMLQTGDDSADFEWFNTYQSRVGPMKWIGPATEDEIERAGADKAPVIVVPIAFVSEHSETLVELDIDYKKLAYASGAPYYGRVPTVGDDATFIAGLAAQVRALQEDKTRAICHHRGGKACPAHFTGCPLAA